MTSFYEVYHVLDIGMPRSHQSIFVQTAELGAPESGHNFHATGNIQEGMKFEHKPGTKEAEGVTVERKTRIGRVSLENYPDKFRQICEGRVEVPKKQFDGAKRLFHKEKIRRCGEWVADAIKVLREEGVLEE
jgi:hypothetical protein